MVSDVSLGSGNILTLNLDINGTCLFVISLDSVQPFLHLNILH
jgi:hypothetical protein